VLSPEFISYLPHVNACLNGTSAILLFAGYRVIRARNIAAHRTCQILALAVSLLFLASYLTYHYHVGDVRFQGHGIIRPIYFTILVTHIILAATIVPLVLITLWRALRGNFGGHRRIARWTWPLWMYVSISGVVVYLMCYRMYPPGYRVAPPIATAASLGPDFTGH